MVGVCCKVVITKNIIHNHCHQHTFFQQYFPVGWFQLPGLHIRQRTRENKKVVNDDDEDDINVIFSLPFLCLRLLVQLHPNTPC